MNTQLKKGDKYGYELTERISEEMSIASGTLYPILRRLKEDAYVTTYLVESESGPARKYYQLTEKGKEYQQAMLQEWEQFQTAVNRLVR